MRRKFRARFSPDPKGYGYLFYPKEYDQGYTYSETEYLKFTSDFGNFLKWMTWIMWSWFLLGMPLIIGLAVWQDYDFSTFDKVLIILFPLPFLALKGWKVFNAPHFLVEGKRPAANRRNQKQLFDARIKGMSWLMLSGLIVVPPIGGYVFLTNRLLEAYEVALGICFFAIIFTFGIYLIAKKSKH